MNGRIGFRRWCQTLPLAGLLLIGHAAIGRTEMGQADLAPAPAPSRYQTTVPAAPKASDLLPCPMSVPCRVDSPVARATQVDSASRAVAARRPLHLLPCPMSVPCIATGTDNSGGLRVSHARPASRERRPLSLRVTEEPSAPAAAPATNGSEVRPLTRIVSSDAPAVKDPVPVPPPTTATAAPIPTRPPGYTSEVALTSTDDLQSKAAQSVIEADQKLAKVDSRLLTPEAARTYGQANELARAAKHAMSEQDYLAAAGLSKKAAELAATLSVKRQPRS
jgi:hypothetical protein